MEETEWTSLRASVLVEADGDIRFGSTSRNALVMTLDGSRRHLTRMVRSRLRKTPKEVRQD